jgi:hypothetical protein
VTDLTVTLTVTVTLTLTPSLTLKLTFTVTLVLALGSGLRFQLGMGLVLGLGLRLLLRFGLQLGFSHTVHRRSNCAEVLIPRGFLHAGKRTHWRSLEFINNHRLCVTIYRSVDGHPH